MVRPVQQRPRRLMNRRNFARRAASSTGVRMHRKCTTALALAWVLMSWTASASARPVRVGDGVASVTLTVSGVAWTTTDTMGATRVGQWYRGRTTRSAPVGPGDVTDFVASDTLAAWDRVQGDFDKFITVDDFRREVLLPSGRVVDLVHCRPGVARCGCVPRGDGDDLVQPDAQLRVDGDHVASGRVGCARGVDIYARTGDGLRRVASVPAATTAFALRGRLLAWGPAGEGTAPVTVYDWRRHRVVARYQHVPPGTYLDLRLSPGGRVLAISSPARVDLDPTEVLLPASGPRHRWRGTPWQGWAGVDRLQAMRPPRFDDDGHPIGSWRRRVLHISSGHVTSTTLSGMNDAAAVLADARHVAWTTADHALWLAPIHDVTPR
jgi:hypothetical protein